MFKEHTRHNALDSLNLRRYAVALMAVELTGEFLTPKQVADLLKVDQTTLCVWRKNKRGPRYIRRASRIYYEVTDLTDWYRNGDKIA